MEARGMSGVGPRPAIQQAKTEAPPISKEGNMKRFVVAVEYIEVELSPGAGCDRSLMGDKWEIRDMDQQVLCSAVTEQGAISDAASILYARGAALTTFLIVRDDESHVLAEMTLGEAMQLSAWPRPANDNRPPDGA
jgi:hypothetical protein